MAVGARQSFQFFKQITWFLGDNKFFRYLILHYLISITKLLENQSVKANTKSRTTLRL